MIAANFEAQVEARLAGGDVRAAAESALCGLGPQVLRFLRSSLRDEEMAGDAFSIFAEELWQGLAKFRGDSSLRTWAFLIARHAALRVRDDRWRKRRVPLSPGPGSRIADAVRSATPAVVEQRFRALESLRDRLSLDEKSLLALRVDQRLPWAEIAEVFAHGGRPVEIAALQKRFQRLKEKLAALAAREGLLER
jgi:RNA polymerase sigma-70 factor (ECF subfamily)